MSRLQSNGERMMSQHGFLGVPTETFDDAGRRQFITLLGLGINPESKVLEIGCGCLRAAYWLIRFLDVGCYYGIEPARQRVQYGSENLFASGELESKRPRFDFNPDFDISVFDTRFDFLLAGSIWTHAGKQHIEVMLDGFVRHANPGATFLASFLPADSPESDYSGDVWVGTSHESNTSGVVRHSLAWIEAQCADRGLQVERLPGDAFDNQYWLRVNLASGF